MAKITALVAREILDARGVPTIEATLWIDNGHSVVASVPSGTSKGKYEALELRDGDFQRMMGSGVLKAINNINTIIAPQIVGKDPVNQQEIDQILKALDGTPNLSKLGANAVLATSIATMKAGALSINLPLYQYIQQKYKLTETLSIPSCIYSVINGGDHGADNLDIQEFQIIPASNLDFKTSLNMASTYQRKLEDILISRGATHSIGLLGGFTPNLYNNTDVFEIMVETIKTTQYTFAQDVFFGIDASASSFFQGGNYRLRDKEQPYSPKELLEYYKNIREVYKVIMIEDPFEEDDHASWKAITEDLGATTRIIGDSYLVTSMEKMASAIKNQSCNTVLVKPNQVGTVSESIEVVKMAKNAGWQAIASHRSGETEDTFIADFAVGTGCEYAKFGPTNRGERVTKYNRLLQICDELEVLKKKQPQQPTAPTTPPATPVQQPAQAEILPNKPSQPASSLQQPVAQTPPTQSAQPTPQASPPPAQSPTPQQTNISQSP